MHENKNIYVRSNTYLTVSTKKENFLITFGGFNSLYLFLEWMYDES